MATSKDYREYRALGGALEVVDCLYDFARDGGATGALDLLKVKEATILVDAVTHVLTTFTSGGSATLIIGRTGDTDAILASTAVASLTAGVLAGDAASHHKLLAADDIINMTIGTAAMTAGKMRVTLFLKKVS